MVQFAGNIYYIYLAHTILLLITFTLRARDVQLLKPFMMLS